MFTEGILGGDQLGQRLDTTIRTRWMSVLHKRKIEGAFVFPAHLARTRALRKPVIKAFLVLNPTFLNVCTMSVCQCPQEKGLSPWMRNLL